MKCPNCNAEINAASVLGSISTDAKAKAARANGAKGGRPPKIIVKRVRSKESASYSSTGVVWEWSVPSMKLGGYCGSKSDALNDAKSASRG